MTNTPALEVKFGHDPHFQTRLPGPNKRAICKLTHPSKNGVPNISSRNSKQQWRIIGCGIHFPIEYSKVVLRGLCLLEERLFGVLFEGMHAFWLLGFRFRFTALFVSPPRRVPRWAGVTSSGLLFCEALVPGLIHFELRLRLQLGGWCECFRLIPTGLTGE